LDHVYVRKFGDLQLPLFFPFVLLICRPFSALRFSSDARCRAAISSNARRFASIRTWE
jgi:hypothetical protein